MRTERIESQGNAVLAATASIVSRCLDERLPADRLLSTHLREHPEFGSRDRRIISHTVFAVLRWWGWLNPLRQPPSSFATSAWTGICAGALLLDPAETPDLLRLWLQRLDAESAAPEALDRTDPAAMAEHLSRLLGIPNNPSHFTAERLLPDWILPLLPPDKTPADVVDEFQDRPPLWLRVQKGTVADAIRELRAAGLQLEVSVLLPGAIRAERSAGNLYTLPVYREGRVEIQDISSQAIGIICAPEPGQRWWDACAGGGGKTLHLARLMDGSGSILATDLREDKLEEAGRRARRAGFSNIRTRAWSGGRVDPRKATFDGVLVDAPCSGSGTWRRNPDARWRTQETDATGLAALQLKLLSAAASGVRPGGCLVYSTCSILPVENQAVVDAFLASNPDFQPEAFPHPFGPSSCAGSVQLWPHDADGDALFAARMRRAPSPG